MPQTSKDGPDKNEFMTPDFLEFTDDVQGNDERKIESKTQEKLGDLLITKSQPTPEEYTEQNKKLQRENREPNLHAEELEDR